MPEPTDVAALYRLHADQLANDEVPRAAYALLVEVGVDGKPRCYRIGPDMPARFLIPILTGVIDVLNAEASH